MGALIYPSAQDANFRGSQAVSHRGHHDVFFQAGDQVDQAAFGAFAGDDGRARISAPFGVTRSVEPQPVHLLLWPVTNVAARENRFYVVVKIDLRC